jgi:general secretion pathway protein G
MTQRIERLHARLGAARAGRARGFTLIEIMVVVVIIGLLAAVIVPEVVNKVDEARIAKAKEDIQSLETALTEYRLDNSVYPSTQQGLKALVKRPNDPALTNWHGPYIQRLVNDPWGHPYQYVYPGTHGMAYDLYTPGPGGGTDTGADTGTGGTNHNEIANWNLGNSN